ncbi:hypothetical protein SASPL_103695 [Salvia splendens]|uniref:Uncharacterized protein n=1 Tax=Salvia splendens TaxID=180675 RepID=A0A8X8YLG3_SALSN|nr:hypothetical protein SASPL_103695 [Salvia splendens]
MTQCNDYYIREGMRENENEKKKRLECLEPRIIVIALDKIEQLAQDEEQDLILKEHQFTLLDVDNPIHL